MTRIKHHHQLITTTAAANEAERRVQEWLSAHAGTDQAKARKAITTQNRHNVYDENRLLIEAITTGQKPLSRRYGAYSLQYQPKTVMTQYSAHALIIFPHEDLGNGVLSITVHEPDEWQNEDTPWNGQWKDPDETVAEIIDRINQQDNKQRRGRNYRSEVQFHNLHEARQSFGPLIIVTPKGDRDKTMETLLQEHRTSANIAVITETEQLNMSTGVPDNLLRQWLTAKAVLVKESYDVVNDHHPLKTFEEPAELRPVLTSLSERKTITFQDMAHRSIIKAFIELLNEQRDLEDVMEEARKQNPTEFHNAAYKLLTQEIENQQEPVEQPPNNDAQDQDIRSQQRISTLEDQLQEQQGRTKEVEDQLQETRAQLKAYEEFMANNPPQDSTPDNEDSAATQAREETVMEAITQPGRFPHLRFLNNVGRDLETYGKPRPTGEEIITALDAVDALAKTYLESDNGNIGSWREYFNLSGWTYANSESDSTMGMYPGSRNFQDHDKNRYISVQRHLTYRGSHSGLQVFFDADEGDQPFIIAYIGEHLPYASSRT